MDTIQLNHALKSRTDLPPGVFKGAFAINQLPFVYTLTRPFAFIVNTDPWPLEGKHWIALFCKERSVVEYFDTAAKPPPDLLWDKLQPNSIVCNTQRLQHDCTSVCGEYCLLFLYARLKRISFRDFLSCFDNSNRLLNDKKAYEIVQQYFDILPHTRPYSVVDSVCVQLSKPLK